MAGLEHVVVELVDAGGTESGGIGGTGVEVADVVHGSYFGSEATARLFVLVVAQAGYTGEVLPQLHLMLSVDRHGIYALVQFGVGTAQGFASVVGTEDGSAVGRETEDTFQLGIVEFLQFGQCIVAGKVVAGGYGVFVARGIVVARIVELQTVALAKLQLGTASPVVTFIVGIIFVASVYAVAGHRTVVQSPIVASGGVEGQAVGGVVGEFLGQVVGTVGQGKLVEGRFEFTVIVGHCIVLPSVGVLILVSGIRAYLALGNVQAQTL